MKFHVIKFYCNSSTCEDVGCGGTKTYIYSQQPANIYELAKLWASTSIDFLHLLVLVAAGVSIPVHHKMWKLKKMKKLQGNFCFPPFHCSLSYVNSRSCKKRQKSRGVFLPSKVLWVVSNVVWRWREERSKESKKQKLHTFHGGNPSRSHRIFRVWCSQKWLIKNFSMRWWGESELAF